MTRTTGIRLNDAQFAKLDQLAQAAGIPSRNAVIVQLIDNALVEERTVAQICAVLSAKNNRTDAKVSQGQSVNAVGA